MGGMALISCWMTGTWLATFWKLTPRAPFDCIHWMVRVNSAASWLAWRHSVASSQGSSDIVRMRCSEAVICMKSASLSRRSSAERRQRRNQTTGALMMA
jgi:hypothetical protein